MQHGNLFFIVIICLNYLICLSTESHKCVFLWGSQFTLVIEEYVTYYKILCPKLLMKSIKVKISFIPSLFHFSHDLQTNMLAVG